MSTPISMPKGYKALGAFPIDASTLFSSLSALQAHAAGTTSYAGQICSVVENNVVTVYKINSDKTLTAIDAVSAAQVNSDWSATTGVAQILNKPGNFGAATPSATGTAGFVPAPAAGHNGRFLRGDASWADIPVPNLPTGSQLTYAEIFNSSTTASITTQLLGAGGLNTSGAGNWVPVVDTNPSIYEIADKSSDVTFNKGTGALTFAAKAATTVYQFVATIGCFKGESGSNGVDIGISIDGANPIVQHYTSIPTPGFTTTQREISVSGVFELSPGVQHTVRLMVRQSGGGNASSANSISMRTLNLNISSINALVEATVFGGVTSVNGQTPDQNGAVTVALPQPSSVNPSPSAVAAVIGTSTDYARADHAHPADLLDAVHIVGQPDSVADGVYFRHDTVLGYPAYKKVNPDGAIVLLEVEVGAGPERWGVLVPSTGETLYRSTNLSSFPWDAAGWTTVDALGAFESISQAKAGVAARKAVTIVTTGEVEQSGPIVSLHPVAKSGDYNDLSNTPTEFAGANATDPGSAGLVPAPLAGDNTKFLRGDGGWVSLPTAGVDTTFIDLTTSDFLEGVYTVPTGTRIHVRFSGLGSGLRIRIPKAGRNSGDILIIEIDNVTVTTSAGFAVEFESDTQTSSPDPLWIRAFFEASSGSPTTVSFYRTALRLRQADASEAPRVLSGPNPLLPEQSGTAYWQLNGPEILVALPKNVVGGVPTIRTNGKLDPLVLPIGTGSSQVAAGDHTHVNFGAATPTADGTAGFVPAPLAGDNTKFLRGDGGWATPAIPSAADIGAAPQGLEAGGQVQEATDARYLYDEVRGVSGGQVSNGQFILENSSGSIITINPNGATENRTYTLPDETGTLSLDGHGHGAFTGATPSTDGDSGFVPAPAAGDSTKFLKGNGTWSAVGAFATLSANNGTLTASAPVLDLSQTWNNTAATFRGVNWSFVDTASGGSSEVLRISTGAAGANGIFSIRKDGNATFGNGINVGTVGGNPTIAGQGGQWRVSSGGAFGFCDTANNAYGTMDTAIYRDAADTLAQRRTTNPQTFRLYKTFTDANNHERGLLSWVGNILKIGAEKAGSGLARAVEFVTDGVTRLTLGASGGVTINSGNLSVTDNTSSKTATFDPQAKLSQDRTYGLPDANGTIALTSDIPRQRAAILTWNPDFSTNMASTINTDFLVPWGSFQSNSDTDLYSITSGGSSAGASGPRLWISGSDSPGYYFIRFQWYSWDLSGNTEFRIMLFRSLTNSGNLQWERLLALHQFPQASTEKRTAETSFILRVSGSAGINIALNSTLTRPYMNSASAIGDNMSTARLEIYRLCNL